MPDVPVPDKNECPHFFRGKDGPIVKILLYTDEPNKVTDRSGDEWGLGVMLQHIRLHAPAFASLCIKLVGRTSKTHADRRLNNLLACEDFDQIWFFGVHQGNTKNISLDVLQDGPHSELEPEESEALLNWMRIGEEDKGRLGGGVLVTGDHADPRPDNAISQPIDHKVEYWGLGRALGRHIPRASQMRKWEGSPTKRPEDRQNTQTLFNGTPFTNESLEFDPMPQRPILSTFDAMGAEAEDGQPHPLFFHRQEGFISVFPDHMHEGAVVLPDHKQLADAGLWPGGIRPQIVARGVDGAKKAIVNLVGAYNGDRARVGRIVADSTWHHYFNVNLNSFRPPGEIDSPTDQLGRFYANLAVWLTPLVKRQEMATGMIRYLANHPAVLEERVFEELNDENRNPVLMRLGGVAYQLLSQLASPCEIHELFNVLLPQEVSSRIETLYLPEKGFAVGTIGETEYLLPSKQLMLGSYIYDYYQKAALAERSGGPESFLNKRFEALATKSFNRAVKVQSDYVKRLANATLIWPPS